MKVFSKIRDVFVSFIAPNDGTTSEIEKMTPAEFCAATKPLSIGRELPKSLILFEYSSPVVRKAIWEIKFRGNRKIARLIATILYDELLEKLSEEKMFGGSSLRELPLLLPIPISGKRFRERGWNQCEIIADEMARLDAPPAGEAGRKNFEVRKNILVKNKNTTDQVGKGRSERLKNIKNTFYVKDEKLVKDRFIIVLDDVVTTGATIEEAGRALSVCGAKRILFLAIAH